jgi:hypothetical protein
VRLWASTPSDLPALGPATGLLRHYANVRAAARLIDDLSTEGARPPADPSTRSQWQESVRTRLQAFGAERLGWPAGYRRLMFGDAFFTAASDFWRAARAFDPNLSLDDLWQAMRNVWIGNSFQMLLDLPVRSTPALFAYSMLYPLTDNLLDNPSIDATTKRGFNDRVGRRLAGLPVAPANAAESAVFELVATIERQFPRHRFADVHDSLLAIHHGQVLSLTQHADAALDDDRLLAISCEKGGASVVADVYLVSGTALKAGRVSEGVERFAFGYGVALQLMDDLQDATRDAAAGHQTLFTRAARRGRLDAATAQLLQFVDGVLARSECFAGEHLQDRIDLLRRNCRSLIVGSVAEQPSLFSARFRRAIARQWPFSLGGLRRLRRRAQQRLPADRALYLFAEGADVRASAV